MNWFINSLCLRNQTNSRQRNLLETFWIFEKYQFLMELLMKQMQKYILLPVTIVYSALCLCIYRI